MAKRFIPLHRLSSAAVNRLNGGSESPEWAVDSEVVTLDPQEDGTVKLIALDYSYEGKKAFLRAKRSNGLEKVLPDHISRAARSDTGWRSSLDGGGWKSPGYI